MCGWQESSTETKIGRKSQFTLKKILSTQISDISDPIRAFVFLRLCQLFSSDSVNYSPLADLVVLLRLTSLFSSGSLHSLSFSSPHLFASGSPHLVSPGSPHYSPPAHGIYRPRAHLIYSPSAHIIILLRSTPLFSSGPSNCLIMINPSCAQ